MISSQRLVRAAPIDMRANYPFKRFNPEVAQPVRQPDVTGQAYHEQVKRTRQMLRSMTPEQVLEVIEFHRDLTFFEAFALAQKEGKLIIPNDVHDRILTETTDEQYLRQNYPVWIGTLVIYEVPDKKFGKNVVFSWKDNNDIEYSISFEVPKQFRGKANCALVIEHPDFELIELGNNRYELKVDVLSVYQIEQFPRRDGWYMYDAKTGIPHGRMVNESSDARRLWRLEDSSYLGPVACSVDVDGDVRWRYVRAGYRSSGRFGVALIGLGEAAPK